MTESIIGFKLLHAEQFPHRGIFVWGNDGVTYRVFSKKQLTSEPCIVSFPKTVHEIKCVFVGTHSSVKTATVAIKAGMLSIHECFAGNKLNKFITIVSSTIEKTKKISVGSYIKAIPSIALVKNADYPKSLKCRSGYTSIKRCMYDTWKSMYGEYPIHAYMVEGRLSINPTIYENITSAVNDMYDMTITPVTPIQDKLNWLVRVITLEARYLLDYVSDDARDLFQSTTTGFDNDCEDSAKNALESFWALKKCKFSGLEWLDDIIPIVIFVLAKGEGNETIGHSCLLLTTKETFSAWKTKSATVRNSHVVLCEATNTIYPSWYSKPGMTSYQDQDPFEVDCEMASYLQKHSISTEYHYRKTAPLTFVNKFYKLAIQGLVLNPSQSKERGFTEGDDGWDTFVFLHNGEMSPTIEELIWKPEHISIAKVNLYSLSNSPENLQNAVTSSRLNEIPHTLLTDVPNSVLSLKPKFKNNYIPSPIKCETSSVHCIRVISRLTLLPLKSYTHLVDTHKAKHLPYSISLYPLVNKESPETTIICFKFYFP